MQSLPAAVWRYNALLAARLDDGSLAQAYNQYCLKKQI
jgi:hypothetical protein